MEKEIQYFLYKFQKKSKVIERGNKRRCDKFLCNICNGKYSRQCRHIHDKTNKHRKKYNEKFKQIKRTMFDK